MINRCHNDVRNRQRRFNADQCCKNARRTVYPDRSGSSKAIGTDAVTPSKIDRKLSLLGELEEWSLREHRRRISKRKAARSEEKVAQLS
jgi:hypothetical protein